MNPTATLLDPYRSRVTDECELAARPDPVVWGSEEAQAAHHGSLSPVDLEHFDQLGYLAFEQLISPELAARLCAEADARADAAAIDDERVVREPDSQRVRSLFAIHDVAGPLADCCRDPRIFALAEQILGSQVYVHQSRVNFKRAFTGKEFFWHSDFETWHLEDGMPRPRAVSLSISLTDNNEFNGPLMVVPGSHRSYVRCVGETPEENFRSSLRKQEVGVPSLSAMESLVTDGGIVAPKGGPGSALMFESNTMHGSVANLSPWPRTNLFIVFNSVENALVDPYGGTAPRPAHIATRNPKPIASQ